MPTRMRWKERKAQRLEEAKERQQARENRGDAGQLLRLEQRGCGECREAGRLRDKLSGGSPGPLEKAPEKE